MADFVIDAPLLAALKRWQHGHACPACERPEAEHDEELLCETMRLVTRTIDLLEHDDPTQDVTT